MTPAAEHRRAAVQLNGRMTTLARFLMWSLGSMLAMVVTTAVAAACSCAEMSTAEHAAQADVVARVIVEHVNMPASDATDGQLATYTMRPTYVWQGDVISQFKVTSEPSGAACGLEGISRGQDLVVFAQESGDGFSATLCGGTAPASDALVAELLQVMGPGVAVDADPAERPGEWVWPTITAAGAVVVIGAVVAVWWFRPRKNI